MTKCERYQELISAMLDGELNDAACADVQAHVASCKSCRDFYEAFSILNQTMAEVDAVPDTLHSGIMKKVNLAARTKRTRKKLFNIQKALAGAACLVLAVGTLLALQSNLSGARKNDNASALEAAYDMVMAGGTGPAAADSLPREYGDVETEAKMEESMNYSSTASAPVPAPVPIEGQMDDGLLYGAAYANAWIGQGEESERVPVEDIAALSRALEPSTDDDTRMTAPVSGDCDYLLYIALTDGTERSLKVYFQDDSVWLEEDGSLYAVSCTPEEFKAIK